MQVTSSTLAGVVPGLKAARDLLHDIGALLTQMQVAASVGLCMVRVGFTGLRKILMGCSLMGLTNFFRLCAVNT